MVAISAEFSQGREGKQRENTAHSRMPSTKPKESQANRELEHLSKALKHKQLKTEATDPLNLGYRRLHYLRYADDFLVGIHGSKADAETIKSRLEVFLIPISVLRDHSKMGKVGHRTETLRVGFQLIESITHLINHVIKRGKSEIRELFFA